jgi:hypothetical protein
VQSAVDGNGQVCAGDVDGVCTDEGSESGCSLEAGELSRDDLVDQ